MRSGISTVGGGGPGFLFTGNLNKKWDTQCLRPISVQDPEAVHVVIGDGAGLHHRNGAEELPNNIRIITFPAYSPELNPAEKLWDIVKERIRPYRENAKKVVALKGEGYLLSELDATSPSLVSIT